jgi:hypothetical protein
MWRNGTIAIQKDRTNKIESKTYKNNLNKRKTNSKNIKRVIKTTKNERPKANNLVYKT